MATFSAVNMLKTTSEVSSVETQVLKKVKILLIFTYAAHNILYYTINI